MKPAVVALSIVLTTSGLEGQKPNEDQSKLKRGDLEGNMRLLNVWGEKPEAAQRLYEAAYRLLASRPDASFADIANDATIQQLCQENRITHLGGPMLGAIGPNRSNIRPKAKRMLSFFTSP